MTLATRRAASSVFSSLSCRGRRSREFQLWVQLICDILLQGGAGCMSLNGRLVEAAVACKLRLCETIGMVEIRWGSGGSQLAGGSFRPEQTGRSCSWCAARGR